MNREELFDKHLRGELSAAEEAELKRLLASDAEAGRAFVEHVGETALFVRVGSQLQSAHVPENVVPLRGAASASDKSDVSARTWTPARRWRVAALAACLAALAGAVVFFQGGTPPPRPRPQVYVTGAGAQVTREGAPLADTEVELRAGDVITASATETATIVYQQEGTRLELQPGAVLVFGDASKGKLFELRHGIVHARVAPQPAGQPLRIKTAHARATVVGTEFLLRTNDEATRLDVLEGKVQLNCRASGKKTLVKAGFGATVNAQSAAFDLTRLCTSNCILRECRGTNAASKLQKLKSNDEN